MGVRAAVGFALALMALAGFTADDTQFSDSEER
jgi:hypothetical protein